MAGIHRLFKSSSYDLNPAAGHENEIALYDPAFESNTNLARILAHEFTHKLYRQLSIDEARSYNLSADWVPARTPRGQYLLIPNRDSYVEEDGKEGPDEDFSNNVEYFLFQPNELRAKTPKVYDWIRRRFGDNFKIVTGSHK